LTVAIAGFAVLQVTVLVRSCVLPSLNVPVAFSCCVLPSANDGFAGSTAIDDSTAAVPVPLRFTFCGLVLALSLKLMLPVRVPVAFGEKVTETVQLVPAASVAGPTGQFDANAKSLVLIVVLLIVNADDWLLVTVTTCGGLVVPSAWPAKFKLVGTTVTGKIPVPVRLTVGLTVALSEIVRAPVRVPEAAGVKKTETVQLAPAVRAFGFKGHAVEVV
jgi:hypothetical protein